ncbi:inorganic phosphate transporter [Chitinilyticum piscinae]|uniref:Phosphate transporter n=1 Tax=Chitinilyticum piscinae TaxID=2866724 RepID=A0A8J7G0P8_9NEIS|nr:inorganic phosphate transporter [Chitinilyticum piscinae]MBE9609830.1 anion permease [Chitinilyticum piscinae]
MLDLFSGLGTGVAISLALALFFVLAFEFINGFHDTANAVATVIYTKAMPPHLAVIASGIFNFFGVLLGGLGVAYAIVHLLPVDLLLDVGSGSGLIMVFALLASAIVWNLGTWYFGLPASSSHTLIGSILGVGIAHALMNGIDISKGVNVKKATDIMLSLLISPTLGFLIAAGLLLLLKKLWSTSRMHMTPEERKNTDGKKHPPFWTRVMLIASAMGVSFAHGSNDGQKGIGLLMLVLIGVAPAKFVVDLNSTTYQIERTRDAARHMSDFYISNEARLTQHIKLGHSNGTITLPPIFKCDVEQTLPTIDALVGKLDGIKTYEQLSMDDRRQVRRMILCLDDAAKKVSKLPELSGHEKSDLEKLRKDLNATTEYAPQWAIVAVALALGLGTMVGWKRIVLTVGEKIGNKGMTYSQGLSAQITATAAISIASFTGMPVSTTHVLSSAVAGTMVANKSGLQGGTVRSILLAWVLTLPITILLSGGLFWLGAQFIH